VADLATVCALYRFQYHAVSDIISVVRETDGIGAVIRKARLRSGLSQRSLARRAGTSQAAISRIERGLERPTFERVEQILAGLGWRPTVALEPLAEHDDEPRRLHEAAGDAPATRLERGLSLSRFAATLDEAAVAVRR
jgi:transcriptional regulator with XRE-family HTH domain